MADAADRGSARPAFAGLVYPVLSLAKSRTHSGSRANLLGPDAPAAKVAARDPVQNVTGDTPPCFLVHAIDDNTVPVENSLDMIAACRAAKVPVSAHLFESGGHGFGTRLPQANPGSMWPELFTRWIGQHV